MKLDDMFAALAAHDDLIACKSVDVWIGGEPTFTRADSLDPAWASAAEGDDKLARAHALATELADQLPGASVSRVVGRTYLEEPKPRFAFGVRWRDDGSGEGERVALDAEPIDPPADLGGEHWLSVTPDPGVVEVNMAPTSTSAAFLAQAVGVWEAAHAAGLAPQRARFNGDLVDSEAAANSRSAARDPMRRPSSATRTCCRG